MIYILSYPRSGNTLIRYIVEYLTNRPTIGAGNGKDDPPIYKRLHQHLKNVKGEPIAKKEHQVSYLKNKSVGNNPTKRSEFNL